MVLAPDAQVVAVTEVQLPVQTPMIDNSCEQPLEEQTLNNIDIDKWTAEMEALETDLTDLVTVLQEMQSTDPEWDEFVAMYDATIERKQQLQLMLYDQC